MVIPKFGRLTNPAKNILKEIETTAKLGFDFVEIGIEGPGGDHDILIKNKGRIVKAIKDNGLFAIGHTPWWVELGSTYENVRQGWVEEGKKIIFAANQLGINLVNFHTHSRGLFMTVPSAKKQVLNNYVKSIRELVAYGKSLGVGVMIENGAERGEIREMPDIKYILDRSKGLGFHLDVGHAYINGGLENVLRSIKGFRQKLWHVHIHDNHGQADEHLPLGSSKLEYEKVVSALKKIGYSKTITLEVFAKDEDYAQYSMNKLKKLWMGK